MVRISAISSATARQVQEFPLQRADTVLGRDRASTPGHQSIDRALDIELRHRVAAHANRHMQIAVCHVTEVQRASRPAIEP